MDYNEKLEAWRNSSLLSPSQKEELESIKNDENQIKLRFAKDISFGTAGLRGILGVGSNCMNEVTVGWITRGVANMLKEQTANPTVVIGRDSRNMSFEFSRLTACIFAAYGVKVYLFDDIRPTAEVSFAVRILNANAGINITASHNPKIYNGYKLYGADGAQISPEIVKKVIGYAGNDFLVEREIANFDTAVKNGLIEIIGDKVDEAYLDEVDASIGKIEEYNSKLKVVYTPIHGSGYKLTPRLLEKRGYEVYTVEEQMTPNGEFPTCDPPNPERIEAYAYAIPLAEKVGADIILATDPDADRQGALILDNGEYKLLTGNQIGVFLCDYRLSTVDTEGKKPFVVKSLVSTDMVKPICEEHNAQLIDVLTGFKYIGEQIGLKEDDENKFIFGFEESYGYLGKGYARDKDAVFASNCFAQAAAWCKANGTSVAERMNSLYEKYGYYLEKTSGFDSDPVTGLDELSDKLGSLKSNAPESICNLKVVSIKDYSNGVDGLPPADILSFYLDGGSRLIIRPSGTEPKVKIYALCRCERAEDAKELCDSIISAAAELLGL